jgi:hypothetical protein
MEVEVPDEWVTTAKDAAWGLYWHSVAPKQQAQALEEMRAALAAVIPAIQNAALDRAAVVEKNAAEEYTDIHPGKAACEEVGAAIRALKGGT